MYWPPLLWSLPSQITIVCDCCCSLPLLGVSDYPGGNCFCLAASITDLGVTAVGSLHAGWGQPSDAHTWMGIYGRDLGQPPVWPGAGEREQVEMGYVRGGLVFSWVFQAITRLWVFPGCHWGSNSASSQGLTCLPHACSPVCLLCHKDAACHMRRLHNSDLTLANGRSAVTGGGMPPTGGGIPVLPWYPGLHPWLTHWEAGLAWSHHGGLMWLKRREAVLGKVTHVR